jgi:hypothetical protein
MTPITQPSPRVAALLGKIRASRGRLIFAIDATASRQPTWDLAARLQSDMFRAVTNLEVQLVWYGGETCSHSAWTEDTHELANQMRRTQCVAGCTQIARVLAHIRAEHQRQKVAAAVFIGDAVEEMRGALYDAAASLDVPIFLFQEGDGDAVTVNRHGELIPDESPTSVETVFRELARLSGGAYGKFDAGAAAQLSELLCAVATFAGGGKNALADLRTDSARKLLAQMK